MAEADDSCATVQPARGATSGRTPRSRTSWPRFNPLSMQGETKRNQELGIRHCI
jgi:hypothetical protein